MTGRGGRGRGDGVRFSRDELGDLAVAWVVLGVAFAIFFLGGGAGLVRTLDRGIGALAGAVGVSLVTAGVAFLCHELGHKVVAVRFGQVARFRADYGMLFLAVMSALVGFLFAAPGAVHHRGRLTARENGLVALAGPAVNVALALAFAPLALLGAGSGIALLELVGARGLAINLFLAAFNLVPYGPLDGRTVLSWSKVVWALSFLPVAAVTVFVVFVLDVGF
ncbi:MAG: metalloprotease [Haloferacaceae archaeon]